MTEDATPPEVGDVTYVSQETWDWLMEELDKPPRSLPRLERLLREARQWEEG